LTLLVPGVLADHPQDTAAPNNFALGTHFLNRRPDFHVKLPINSVSPEPAIGSGRQNEAALFTAVSAKEQVL